MSMNLYPPVYLIIRITCCLLALHIHHVGFSHFIGCTHYIIRVLCPEPLYAIRNLHHKSYIYIKITTHK